MAEIGKLDQEKNRLRKYLRECRYSVESIETNPSALRASPLIRGALEFKDFRVPRSKPLVKGAAKQEFLKLKEGAEQGLFLEILFV